MSEFNTDNDPYRDRRKVIFTPPTAHDAELEKQQRESYQRERNHRNHLMDQRFVDPDAKKTFRNAYVFKTGADYSTLKPYCENIILVTDGFVDHLDNVRKNLETNLAEYDSDKDVIVVIGRAFDNLLVGMIVAQKVLEKPKHRQSYAIAVYYKAHYMFYEVPLDPSVESHEVLTR